MPRTDADDDPSNDQPTNGELDAPDLSHTPVPEQDPMPRESGEVNIWDPVEGEGFNERGHWADVPDHRLPRLLEGGPVLIQSDMRGVPTEGVQGSYTVAHPERECPKCGLPGVHHTAHTMAGVHGESCPHCDWSEAR